jgi:predicted ribosome quality control (RQC) complex YloA/Tae2 family protein
VKFANQNTRIQLVEAEVQRIKELIQKSDVDLLSTLRLPKKGTHLEQGGSAQKAASLQKAEKTGGSVGKKLNLSDSEFVVVGKSAADNLQILRDAQPWDLWLHLKDLPSAHGIVRRHRGKPVTDEKLIVAIHYILKMTPKVARHLKAGDRVEGLVAECRYVSPLKGDHLGRVTVKESRTLAFKFDPQKYPREN